MSQKSADKPRIISPSARTPNQKTYLKAIDNNDIVICEGPAGTGKTHLAIGMASFYLKKGKVEKIFIVRPAVEAEENLGFLPGDVDEKMGPFIRPVFDELSNYMYYKEVSELIERKVIEIVPIAYMRGRTLKNAFVVVDEAQNLTFGQMKMLLTRLGECSKMVLTGDCKQSDLLQHKKGAFAFAKHIIKDIDNTEVVILTKKDNQRHPLVEKIVDKWEKNLDFWQKSGTIK